MCKTFLKANRKHLLIEENDNADVSDVAAVLALTTVNQMTLYKALDFSEHSFFIYRTRMIIFPSLQSFCKG